MRHLLILLIRIYQRVLSPLKPPTCRFYPSCSQYAAEALARRGLLVGAPLAFWRILRCNPWCRGGYDPVPEHGWTPQRTQKSETDRGVSPKEVEKRAPETQE